MTIQKLSQAEKKNIFFKNLHFSFSFRIHSLSVHYIIINLLFTLLSMFRVHHLSSIHFLSVPDIQYLSRYLCIICWLYFRSFINIIYNIKTKSEETYRYTSTYLTVKNKNFYKRAKNKLIVQNCGFLDFGRNLFLILVHWRIFYVITDVRIFA